MDLKEKVTDAVTKLENKTGEIAGKAKDKISESLTEEKRAEYRKKIGETVDSAGKGLSRFGSEVSSGIKNILGKKD